MAEITVTLAQLCDYMRVPIGTDDAQVAQAGAAAETYLQGAGIVPASCPALYTTAVLCLALHWYDTRGSAMPTTGDGSVTMVPMQFRAMVCQLKAEGLIWNEQQVESNNVD